MTVAAPSRPDPQRPASLVSYLLGAVLAVALVSAAFVSYRNETFRDRERARAAAAAHLVATGRTAADAGLLAEEIVVEGVVAAARPSRKYPFLRRRALVAPQARPLGGPEAPVSDKLLADAATQAERDGSFADFLKDGSGRVMAASPGTRGTAVVVLAPATRPEPYPWLPVGGLLILGTLMTALAGRDAAGVRAVAIGASLAAFALLPANWGRGWVAGVILVVTAIAVWLDLRGTIGRGVVAVRKHRVAYTYLLPATFGMAVLVVAPFLVGCVLGFFDHSRGEWEYVGLANFTAILGGGGRSLSDPLNFWFTFGVTMAWTTLNVALHVTIGVVLALALKEPWLRAKGWFRVLLILPWAIPNYITALIWQGMFQQQYGAVNSILEAVGLEKVAWFSQFSTAFTANVVTNVWLGFPFMMVAALGALQSIPRDVYEAAEVDGARSWQRFWHITLPNLRPALVPAVVLGSIWTFNMFNVIYLVSGGKPAGATDILVTEAYRWAFERGQRFGMASAYALIIFVILALWTLVVSRTTREVRA